ncbi:MAG: tetratricopeptide repeat protein [Nitrospirae bacterium]|nr:tetratricopeptide repeat protein [Nitrospirota bacterium]
MKIREGLKYQLFSGVFLLIIGVFSSCNDGSRMAAEDYVSKATKYYKAGDIDKAIKTYDQALKEYPDDANMHFTLGEIYFLEHKRTYDEAQKKLTLHFLKKGSKTLSRDEIERALIRNGYKVEYAELAQKEFQAAVSIDPSNWIAREHIAGYYFGKNRYEDAIREYQIVISLNPQNVRALTSIGHVYLKKGSYDLAVANLNKALAVEADDEYTYYLLGQAYRKINEGEKYYAILTKLKNMHSVWYEHLRLHTFGEVEID